MAGKWIELVIAVLSKISQTQRDMFLSLTHVQTLEVNIHASIIGRDYVGVRKKSKRRRESRTKTVTRKEGRKYCLFSLLASILGGV